MEKDKGPMRAFIHLDCGRAKQEKYGSSKMSDLVQRLKAAILSAVPADGTPIGNIALRHEAEGKLHTEGFSLSDAAYWQAHAVLIANGALVKGQGRGGSVRRVDGATDDLSLTEQAAPPTKPAKPKIKGSGLVKAPMPRYQAYWHETPTNPEFNRIRISQ